MNELAELRQQAATAMLALADRWRNAIEAAQMAYADAIENLLDTDTRLNPGSHFVKHVDAAGHATWTLARGNRKKRR